MIEPAVDVAAVQRRTLRVLVAGQILGGAAMGIGAGVSALLAKDILGDDTFAGLAFAAAVFGAALAAVPLSRGMARHGRRYGLTRGYAVSTVGAALAVVAAEAEWFPLLLLAMLLFGVGTATNLLARYAGADLAPPLHRARAISLVVWATTVGAVAGPNLLGPAGRLATAVDLPRLAGPYLVSIGCFLVAGALEWALLRPDPMEVAGLLDHRVGAERVPAPPIRAQFDIIRRSPAALTGLITMGAAHAVMVGVMTMTPLHLRDHGDSLELVGLVISLHIAGMYAFSPVVGMLADRHGHLHMARTAAVTLALAAVFAAGAGHNHGLIGAGLVLLGVGWCMATISGSALLTDAAPFEDRARVQGVADMTMGVMGGTASVLAGVVVGAVGYRGLSAIGAGLAVALLVMVMRSVTRVPAPARSL